MKLESIERIMQSYVEMGAGATVTLYDFDIEAFKEVIDLIEKIRNDR